MTHCADNRALPDGKGSLMTGKAASLSSAWERCCDLTVELLLSLPRCMSNTAQSWSVAGPSSAFLTVKACSSSQAYMAPVKCWHHTSRNVFETLELLGNKNIPDTIHPSNDAYAA